MLSIQKIVEYADGVAPTLESARRGLFFQWDTDDCEGVAGEAFVVGPSGEILVTRLRTNVSYSAAFVTLAPNILQSLSRERLILPSRLPGRLRGPWLPRLLVTHRWCEEQLEHRVGGP